MKKIVPFTKDLMFKTKIGEITSIALDNTLKLDGEIVSGEFIVSGTYKMLDVSQTEEEFKYNIPVDITIDPKYETKNCVVSIDDFSYEIINEENLKVNISVMLDDLDIKDDPVETIEVVVPKEDKEEIEEVEVQDERKEKEFTFLEGDVNDDLKELENLAKEKNISIKKEEVVSEKKSSEEINVNTDFSETLFQDIEEEKEFSIYRVYTVKEDDTIDIICDKFNTNKEILSDYNDLDNLVIGSKLIIPSNDE